MNRTIQYWAVIFILQVLFIAWYKGMLTPDVFQADSLVMTATEAKLTKQAIEMVRGKIIDDEITTTELAIQALSSLLPRSVREQVIDALGKPDIGFMCDALDTLKKQIKVRN